ncbi:MAG: sugar phosphate isomerase/epimerase [Lentisphaerae bacterium]|jgi:sugar phosphate isomerase/epimerase|nr:sugar phosphate isomerase/epimerase [Lentisphaerota bacterium]MBT4822051.1 sugar phosphate isomerase/epimerase [Lentisphaerota bacterium]MBT5609151.1 sugar phosphate isomerase/epimerase [Lentisphaerota bacterium]MBT7054169.1 sugar phosphate isomerase/epimerase [Lentisphaerota bacterium]MBT7841067.1 sugar phosphate isomerase/epimerase [Lentisphaerota bacterium]
MRGDIRSYARLGLVHHMLYPSCMDDPDDHVRTLREFIARDDIETLDCCLPYGDERRETLIPLVRDCGKVDITFATHLFPLRKIGLPSPAPNEQAQIRMIMGDMIDMAAAIGATGFIFASGCPCPEEAAPAHYHAFADFCRWLCGELKPHGITAQLEPFDTDIDKCFLYGPTQVCAELVESLRPDVDNLGLELDLAHVPLMRETFDQAITNCAPYLKRVHLGNCVLKDTTHPRYGDTHPPVGFPGGEIDVPQLTTILRCLLETGFLNQAARGNLVIEMTPWPGKSVEETISDSFARLDAAWRAL